MNFGVVVFPGSNCDYDSYRAIKDTLKQPVKFVWHQDIDIEKLDVIIIPGGFSYGDYLRAGAIARFSPVIKAIREFADKGGLVLGICNGFQILTESGLLPGTLMSNRGLRFKCKDIYLKTENNNTKFTFEIARDGLLRLPIAHNEGNFYCSADEYKRIEDYGGIVFRYCSSEGELAQEFNPNGSLGAVAGIINEKGNVMGMMPHPERYVEGVLGGEDGKYIFDSIINGLGV
ncbi:MAG: phosphoribosylformylglycinamidine synthase subunit PurQ [candidate division Zixibacteria bacterium]|nr:phosphoribosylformylglycinamidine synthase subunit PurQ [candidate division Zixibacteria bacterium]